jgi:tetratricopeptide (TPR) repeat protein
MLRTSSAVLLAAVLLLGLAVVAVPQSQDEGASIDEAYKSMIEERRGFESMADRLAVTKKFLAEYPDTKYTARLIMHVYYYQAERLEDIEGAVAYAEELRGKVETAEFVAAYEKSLGEIYGEAGLLDKMVAIADKLEAAGEMNFNDYWSIVQIATANDEWKMVRKYCAKGRPLANAESFRSDYPERDFTDEEVEKAGANRLGMISGKDAWAMANLGQIDEALAEFASAGKSISRSYVGVLEYDVGLHWAKTLLKKGDYEGAIEQFAPEALIMSNEDALAGLRKAYAKKNGSEDGFEGYAEKLHFEIAPKVKDFELPDYDGKRVKYRDVRGDVTLLAFWFPT